MTFNRKKICSILLVLLLLLIAFCLCCYFWHFFLFIFRSIVIAFSAPFLVQTNDKCQLCNTLFHCALYAGFWLILLSMLLWMPMKYKHWTLNIRIYEYFFDAQLLMSSLLLCNAIYIDFRVIYENTNKSYIRYKLCCIFSVLELRLNGDWIHSTF